MGFKKLNSNRNIFICFVEPNKFIINDTQIHTINIIKMLLKLVLHTGTLNMTNDN